MAACASCGVELLPKSKFCGACGARVSAPPPTACACGAPLLAGQKFCGGCGQRVGAVEATPEALERYDALLGDFAANGVLEQGELDELARRRDQLGVSEQQHAQAVARHKAFLGMPVRLEFDPESAYLVAKQPSSVDMRLTNAYAGVVRHFEVHYRCTTTSRLHRVQKDHQVTQGYHRRFPVVIDPPPSAGQYRLDGYVVCTFRDGRIFRGHFELPALRADTAEGAERAVNIQSINVDAHHAAMVKDIGNIDLRGRREHGAVVASSDNWSRVELHAATEEQLLEWRRPRGEATDVVVGELHRCRGVRLRMRRGSTEARRELWLVGDDELVLGRTTDRADLVAAVEPYLPAAQHPQNVALSMKISSRHLQLRLTGRGAFVSDLGSSNGTTFDGRRLAGYRPEELLSVHRIRLADALTLEAEPLAAEDLSGVWLRRIDNLPNRSYLLFRGCLGLWPHRRSLVGPPTRSGESAPLLLSWHKGAPCLANRDYPELRVAAEEVPPGRRVAVGPGQRIELGTQWTLVIQDTLGDKVG